MRKVCGENVIMAFGMENIDFSKVISLNESAACLWEAFADHNDFTIEDMVKVLVAEYEVSEEEARHDCERLAKEWRDTGLID